MSFQQACLKIGMKTIYCLLCHKFMLRPWKKYPEMKIQKRTQENNKESVLGTSLSLLGLWSTLL